MFVSVEAGGKKIEKFNPSLTSQNNFATFKMHR